MTTKTPNETALELFNSAEQEYIQTNLKGEPVDVFLFTSKEQSVLRQALIKADKADRLPKIDDQQFAIIFNHLRKTGVVAPWILETLEGYLEIIIEYNEAKKGQQT